MLSKAFRLSAGEIRSVTEFGHRHQIPELILTICPKKKDVPAFAIIVSKRVSMRAVIRNRVKRILREQIKTILATSPVPYDAVLTAKRAILTVPPGRLAEFLHKALTAPVQ